MIFLAFFSVVLWRVRTSKILEKSKLLVDEKAIDRDFLVLLLMVHAQEVLVCSHLSQGSNNCLPLPLYQNQTYKSTLIHRHWCVWFRFN